MGSVESVGQLLFCGKKGYSICHHLQIMNVTQSLEETSLTAIKAFPAFICRPSDIMRWCDFTQSTSNRIRSHNSQKIA